MVNKRRTLRYLTGISVLLIFLSSSLLSVSLQATNIPSTVNGFAKGISWKSVVPTKKVTFVNLDTTTYIDDFSYLAAIPTSVFYDPDGNRLFSHPLLFYEEEIAYSSSKERLLNAREGIDYFMDDWLSYCDGKLDQLVAINLTSQQIVQWPAKNTTFITGKNPYEIAGQIALNDWSYSDDVVIAVIDDLTKTDLYTNQEIKGSFFINKAIRTEHFETQQTNSLTPVFYDFIVPEGYKHLQAFLWWDCLVGAGFISVPTGDPDLQLYCRHNNDWMEVAAMAKWNIMEGPLEDAETYVYDTGPWRVGVTDMPTENIPRKDYFGGLLSVQGSLFKILKNLWFPVTYNIDIVMQPGMEISLSDSPSFDCQDVEFILEWTNPKVQLGFSLIGPSGEEIVSISNNSSGCIQRLSIDRLGECLPGENYSLCIYSLGNTTGESTDFTINYSMHQYTPKRNADYLDSASQGAILASILNAPLLYLTPTGIPTATVQAMEKLGVTNIYIVDVGDHLSSSTRHALASRSHIKEIYREDETIYNAIRSYTRKNDIIFSTINPWTYYYVGELMPAGEHPRSLFIGPAAYLAAQHGSPLILVEQHPDLSSAIVWHNEFWRRYSNDRFTYRPSVAEMYITGKRVYHFIDEIGFDQDGLETIITVADQYEIGMPWDRIFVGTAKPGRICGSPTDAAYWISRITFYPALIYENPALDPNGIQLINGSISTRKPLGVVTQPFANTLSIQRPSTEETYRYPILCSFVTHKYRFNERGSNYYGSVYQCADGFTPGFDYTFHPIDEGLGEKYSGIKGSVFPDMTESEIIPIYLERAGYDVAFSTALEPVIENLNSGVVMWIHASHGNHPEGGSTLFWEPDVGFSSYDPLAKLFKIFAGAKREENPWRGYEWYLGSTEEPDTMSMDIIGTIPFTNIRFPLTTGFDWALARKPVREFLNWVIPFFSPFTVDDRYDGVIGTVYFSRYMYVDKNISEIEPLLDNIHSAGFITGICQTSNTYFHLSLVRHGSVFQIQDPWPTSWYGAVWRQSIPRDMALGDTLGEAYVKGLSHVGILYITDPPQWWWDNLENVILFGDPDLRVWTPDNEYSSENYWDKKEIQPLSSDDTSFYVGGHMLYGATTYPHQKENLPIVTIGIILAVCAALIIIGIIAYKKRSNAKS